jgi:hypothetical protein
MGYRSEVALAIRNLNKVPGGVKRAIAYVFGDPIEVSGKGALYQHDSFPWDEDAIVPGELSDNVKKISKWMEAHLEEHRFVRLGDAPGDEDFQGEWEGPFQLGWTRKITWEKPCPKKKIRKKS